MLQIFFSVISKLLPQNSLLKLLFRVSLAKINALFNNDLKRHIKIREKYSLFDETKLSQPLRKPNDELLSVNSLYGISSNLKKYCGYNGLIYAAIEHGVRFGGHVGNAETVSNPTSAIITFGKERYKYLSDKTEKDIYTIGPYIHYANQLFADKEFEKLKNRLGKMLLVFPSHSIDLVKANFDSNTFVDFLRKKSKAFDSVVICMYWKDISLDKHEVYKKEGFKVATGGHRNDPNFLSRLKSLIQLSDATLSNDVGTHIGYCIYLNKPHHIYQQDVTHEGIKEDSLENEFGNRGENYQKILEEEKKEIFDAFSEFENNIKQEQIDVCNKHWGFEYIKEADELNEILESIKAQTFSKYLSIIR